MSVRAAVRGLLGPFEPSAWSSASMAVTACSLGQSSACPLFAALGLRVGIQSEEQLAARIEADAAAMRNKGYLVASTQTFSLPVIGAPRQTANWYRVTFELASPKSR